MLKLIAWIAAVYALYRFWVEARRRQADHTDRVRPGSTSQAERRFDRTQIVDAEFTDVDDMEESGR